MEVILWSPGVISDPKMGAGMVDPEMEMLQDDIPATFLFRIRP